MFQAALLFAGCQSKPPVPVVAPSAQLPTSVALRVLVVNDPALAEAIGRLTGEWHEQSGGELTASSKPWSDVAAAENIEADVIIFPTRYLGELCTRSCLRPVRKSVLEDKTLDFEDVFPIVRRQLITWGGQVMALPLGVEFSSESKPDAQRALVRFLELAGRAAISPNRVGDLFDPDTMKPRISEPAFVDALKQLERSRSTEDPAEPPVKLRLPILGIGDRFAAVTTTSRNAASAFQLLDWLATADVSSQLAHVGDVVMPVRKSLVASPAWYDPKISVGERAELGKTLEASLSGNECLIVPRIPGVDEYMAALERAINDVTLNNANPSAALQQAAATWDQITDGHGRDAQRQAYLKHLGISE
jgi:hypothetical protein